MSLRAVLAENLKSLRKQHGLSQEALADLAGLDRSYISHLEREVYAASVDAIEKLAQALEVTPPKLIEVSKSKIAN